MLPYLIQNKDITNLSGYRTKSITRYFFELKNIEDMEKIPEIMDFAKKENLKTLFLGGGMNCLFAFDVFEGIVIKNNFKGFEIIDQILEINSGENMIFLVSKLEKEFGILNLKPWSSLPGTVGGAIVGNAGCFGLEIKDVFISAQIYDLEENTIIQASYEFMEFEYRNSILKGNKRYFLISAKFNVSKNMDNSFSEDFRFKNQPKGFSCGSVFKNPKEGSAGKLIEETGLKGTLVGGAKISEIHGNFIVSDGTASYNNIFELKNLCQKVVFEKFGIELEEEINIITN